MSRYIDVDVLIDDLVHNRCFYPAIVSSAIKNTPTANVVEVVRCRNCEHWLSDDIGRRYCELIDCWTGDSDYCSRGRREETI